MYKRQTLEDFVDADIADANTYENCAYQYVRMSYDPEKIAEVGAGQQVQYAWVGSAGALKNAVAYTMDGQPSEIHVNAVIDLDEALNIDKACTIIGEEGNQIDGSFIVNADNVTLDKLNITNEYVDGNDSATKNALNIYADNVTVTNCTFEAAETAENYEPNGIVIFPKTDKAEFKITDNTFIGYNKVTTDGMYCSAAIFIAEEYPMDKKPFFNVNISSADLPENFNDAAIAEVNTYENCAYQYLRQDGFDWAKPAVGQTVQYALVATQEAYDNANAYKGENAVIRTADDFTPEVTEPGDEEQQPGEEEQTEEQQAVEEPAAEVTPAEDVEA